MTFKVSCLEAPLPLVGRLPSVRPASLCLGGIYPQVTKSLSPCTVVTVAHLGATLKLQRTLLVMGPYGGLVGGTTRCSLRQVSSRLARKRLPSQRNVLIKYPGKDFNLLHHPTRVFLFSIKFYFSQIKSNMTFMGRSS